MANYSKTARLGNNYSAQMLMRLVLYTRHAFLLLLLQCTARYTSTSLHKCNKSILNASTERPLPLTYVVWQVGALSMLAAGGGVVRVKPMLGSLISRPPCLPP
jgi:hypothetical protein